MSSAAPSVLFVCLGNICRSPLAEATFRLASDEAGFCVGIDSAGTGDWHVGNPPDPRAQAVACKHGVDISWYRARQIAADDFCRFTHIVALDHQNLADLRARKPKETTAELSLLLDHAEGRVGEAVADPYHSDADGFMRTWNDVSAGAAGLISRMRSGA